jgi:hypothetical protein
MSKTMINLEDRRKLNKSAALKQRNSNEEQDHFVCSSSHFRLR